MCHGPLHSTTCSTRATRSPLPPLLPFLARTPACLPTDRRHSRLPLSSHRSPDVLHSLSLPLSLAPARACPPTDRRNDATTASLNGVVTRPSEVYSLHPRLHHSPDVLDSLSLLFSPSLAPTGACPPIDRPNDGVVTHALGGFLRAPNVLYSLDPRLHRSCSRPLPSGRVHCPLSRASSQIPLTPGHLRRHSYQHQQHFIDHPTPAFCPHILSRFERRFTVGFQSS